MSYGRLSVSNILTSVDLSKLIEKLTFQLHAIEKEMINVSRAGKNKISKITSENYITSLNELTQRLRVIADHLFHETKISKVKAYREKDEIPDNYLNYLHVSENLALMVAQDVLNQPDLLHVIAVFERWIHLCKMSFHQHDFFIASCIINGLNFYGISAANIEKEINKKSARILNYYRNMLDKASLIYHRQKKLIKYKLNIVPALYVLANMHEKISAKPIRDDKEGELDKVEVQIKKRTVSKEFSAIKKKNSARLTSDDNNVLSSLYRFIDKDWEQQADAWANELKKWILHEQDARKTKTKKIGHRFSISLFSELNESRVELILLTDAIEHLENAYDEPINQFLYDLRSTICNSKYTDLRLFSKINEKFILCGFKLDDKLRELKNKILNLLEQLIKTEFKGSFEPGRFFDDHELKISYSEEDGVTTPTVKSRSDKAHLLRRQPRFFVDMAGSSSLGTEERTPKKVKQTTESSESTEFKHSNL